MLNEKLSSTRDKYLADKLDEDDYKDIKKNTKSEIEKLEEDLSFAISETKTLDIKLKLDQALDAISNISKLYAAGDLHTKRIIGCLIFPKKVEFDGKTFQTPEMNIIARCIMQYNSSLAHKKTDIKVNYLLMPVL